jgi:HD-like signal output (HDOD) protein
MKKWIGRLMGASDESESETDDASSREGDQHAGDQEAGMVTEVEAAYYRWLTSSAGRSLPPETENRILEAVQQLTGAPGDAADLVPRVPEVIPQLLRSLRDEGVSAADLSRQVAQDMVLVAEVIRESNSAYYSPITPVRTIENAIMMLGQNGLRMLLARIAFRPLIKMQAEGFAHRAAPHVWSQSEKCALAASLLAPGLTAGVFEAYLAGLMQNVGLIVAFRLIHRLSPDGKVPGSSEFGAKLLASSRQLSAGIARHWEFPPAVADAIAQAGAPGDSPLAQSLALGDRISKLRMLVDACVLDEDDPLIADGLDGFQRRCFGKLHNLDG